MNIDLVVWLWFCSIFCMQIIPWSISGFTGILQIIPSELSDNNKNKFRNNKFLRDLFQNQISILFTVPIGIVLLDQVENYGLTPSLPTYFYFAAPIVGIFLIWFGIQIYKFNAKILHKFLPKQLEHDTLQYQYNMKNLFEIKTWEKITLGLFNGFSEEMLMRVFLMGFLINYLNIHPVIALIISLILNGLHHTQQGRILGSTSIVVIQFFYAISYLLLNDYLFIGIMHVSTDISGLLLPSILKKRNEKGSKH